MATENGGPLRAPTTYLTWGETAIEVEVGSSVAVPYSGSSTPLSTGGVDLYLDGKATSEVGSTAVTFTGVSVGVATIPYDSSVGNGVITANALTITVVASVEDESYLNKRGLTHFWENIDDIKQNKLTAGAGILITGDTISATGGGTADAVDWGHITGSMSNQTDLTTALNAKADSADLATVATSGSYNDLSNKPTIPTVNNATLTIQKNSTSVGTFTANASSNKTINITVPTTAADVSALPASTKYGASISVSVNTTDYKVTTTLKDQDGNTLGTAQVIDLPLESVVVNGSYDNTNKKIVLTLQNGNTVDIPVADLVAGLQSEITSTNKLASDLVDDTNQTHKFMTSAEKTKLSGIAAGAEVNVQSDWSQTNSSADDFIKNKPTNVSAFTNDAGYITSYTDNKTAQTLTKPTTTTTYYPVSSASSSTNTADVKKFSGMSLSYSDNEGGFADLKLGYGSLNGSVAGSISLVDAVGATGSTKIAGSGKNSTENHTLKTPDTSGRLVANSSDSAATGSTIHPVYADSNGVLQQTTYTLEKSVPSNAVFTDTTYDDATTSTAGLMSAADKVKLNSIATGAEVNVQSDWNVISSTSDAFIKNKPTIPTKTSDLTNDSGFLTSYTETDPIFSASAAAGITSADITSWNNKSTFSGSYNDLTNKPTIGNATLTIQKNGASAGTFTANATANKSINITVPTATSDLTNDSGFLSSVAWGDVTGKPTFATVATSGSYNDLSNKPTIPAAQVQSNWTQTTTTAVDYIKNKPTLATVATSGNYNDLSNKPTIPTVNNATLTIQKNGVSVQTFTANSSTNKTANIAVPTATSDLTNDGSDGTDTYVETADIADFITAEDIASTSALTPPVQTNMIADGAVTSAKIDWSTITSTDLSSSFVWDSGMSTSSTNDRNIHLYKNGNIVYVPILVAARSNYQFTTSWVNIGTLPVGARPICEVTGPIIANNRDSGQPTGYGKFTISTAGLIRVRTNTTVSNCQALFGGISWPTA